MRKSEQRFLEIHVWSKSWAVRKWQQLPIWKGWRMNWKSSFRWKEWVKESINSYYSKMNKWLDHNVEKSQVFKEKWTWLYREEIMKITYRSGERSGRCERTDKASVSCIFSGLEIVLIWMRWFAHLLVQEVRESWWVSLRTRTGCLLNYRSESGNGWIYRWTSARRAIAVYWLRNRKYINE